MGQRDTIAALESAAVDIDGKLYVRASRACKIMGATLWFVNEWPRRGLIHELVLPARGPGAPSGKAKWWPLEECIAMLRRRARDQRKRPWTPAQEKKLHALIQTHGMAEAARRLGRTAEAIKLHLHRTGGGLRRQLRERERLVTAGELARIVRKSGRNSIAYWCDLGLPCRRRGPRGERCFRLDEVRAWLASKPNLLVTLHPEVRRLLKLTPAEIEGRAA